MVESIPAIKLNSKHELPMLGLGVYKATAPGEVEKAISTAVTAGYHAIDTASVYKNEDGVGRAIKSCGLDRKDLFVITKIWNNAQRMGDVIGSFQRSMERLKVDYIDLYLIHWPVPGCYIQTWKELIKLNISGKIKSIGVSNFDIVHLNEIMQFSDILPAVNQIECHPYCYPKELIHYCQSHGIAVQAYAPLARGAYADDPLLTQIGSYYGKTASQVGLRWLIQKGIAIIPKSTNPEHIYSNGNIFDFTLTNEEMEMIDTLDRQQKYSSIPDDMKPFY